MIKPTLNFWWQRPAFSRLNLVDCDYFEFWERYLSMYSTSATYWPANEAVKFYFANHLMAELQKKVNPEEPLGKYEPLVEQYSETVLYGSLHMFAYILLICGRESRHCPHGASTISKVTPKVHPKVQGLILKIRGTNNNLVERVTLNSDLKGLTMREYLSSMKHVFKSSGFSGGFGGLAWAKIANIALMFVEGEISTEVFYDSAWSARHNNGTIFNKEYIYHSDTIHLKHVLDCQATGGIPALVRQRLKVDHAGAFKATSNSEASLVNHAIAGMYGLGSDLLGPLNLALLSAEKDDLWGNKVNFNRNESKKHAA